MTETLDYEAYDRQINNLMAMCKVLVNGWNDYGTQELNCDLRSIRTKASRLCYMSELDYAMQLNDLTKRRATRNLQLREAFRDLVYNDLVPLMHSVVDGIRQGYRLEGLPDTLVPLEMGELLPRMVQLLPENNAEKAQLSMLSDKFNELDKLYKEKLKPTKFAGMMMIERLWYLIQIFMLSCCLLYHFERAVAIATEEGYTGDAKHILLASIRQFSSSPEGKRVLDAYYQTVLYENDYKQPTLEQLKEARKALRHEVPSIFHDAFVANILDWDKLAEEVCATQATTDEQLTFVQVMAKWQMMSREIERMERGERSEPDLYNEVLQLPDSQTTLKQLRTKIAQMVKHVEKKNHWMCIWCVLNHHDLIADHTLEAFAKQMMHPDWFGGQLPKEKRFTGDTIREYSGYFTLYDYTQWSESHYLHFKQIHNKTKWSNGLWKKFQDCCIRMDDAFRGNDD